MIKPRLWIISLYVAGSADLASSVIAKILLHFFQSLAYDIISILHGLGDIHRRLFLIPILLLLWFIMVECAIYLYSYKATRTMKTNYNNIWRVNLVPSSLRVAVIPFCLLWASFNDRHFKNVASWFGGQFWNIIWIFCVRGLMVAFPSCKNRLWMVNSFKRKVFPNGDWLLTMSRNSSRPKTTVILLKVHCFVTTPLELRYSTVKQRSNSLASITLSK